MVLEVFLDLVLPGVLAAAAELGGTWLVWQGIRGNRSWLWAGGGFLVLALYGLIVTFQGESSFGRIMAAYGGLFIAGALVWGMVADGYHPDLWDLIGAGICLTGAGVIMFAPRG